MGTTGAPLRKTGTEQVQPRHQPPIRWPHPSTVSLALVGVWAVGAFLALFVPVFFVSPTATKAPATQVWSAFGATLAGSVVMGIAALGLFRRSRDQSVLILGSVPAVACIAGGVILTATKLTGT